MPSYVDNAVKEFDTDQLSTQIGQGLSAIPEPVTQAIGVALQVGPKIDNFLDSKIAKVDDFGVYEDKHGAFLDTLTDQLNPLDRIKNILSFKGLSFGESVGNVLTGGYFAKKQQQEGKLKTKNRFLKERQRGSLVQSRAQGALNRFEGPGASAYGDY